MALTFTNFATFADVEADYNNTVPLGGAGNAGKDIRPIGDRKRKWERIVKVSPNCYALSDGNHFGDGEFPAWTFGRGNFKPTLKDMEKYAPIVWRKKRDGTEEVTVRNGWGPHQHNSRYSFLYRHTPRNMWFRNRNGKHFIQVGQTDYYLAKVRTTPEPLYRAFRDNSVTHHSQRMKNWVMLHDDDASLTFTKDKYGGWVLINGGKKLPTPPRKVVQKNVKAKYKKHISTFKEWAFTMGAMLPIHDYNYVRGQFDVVNEWAEANGISSRAYWGDPIPYLDVEIKRQVVCDEEHPLRLSMAVAMLRSVEAYRLYDTDVVHLVKQRTNTWINKQLGFIKEVQG